MRKKSALQSDKPKRVGDYNTGENFDRLWSKFAVLEKELKTFKGNLDDVSMRGEVLDKRYFKKDKLGVGYYDENPVIFGGPKGLFIQDDDFAYIPGTQTLYVPNLSVSGGISLPGLTPGSVLFAGPAGLISEDNANLFWDDTNNRLGINTNTPGYSLDITGTLRATGNTLIGGTLGVTGATTLSNYTSTYIPFFGVGGLVSESANLVWDGSALDITGDLIVSGDIETSVADTHVMYSNAGVIEGSANLTWDGSLLDITGGIAVSGNIDTGITDTTIFYSNAGVITGTTDMIWVDAIKTMALTSSVGDHGIILDNYGNSPYISFRESGVEKSNISSDTILTLNVPNGAKFTDGHVEILNDLNSSRLDLTSTFGTDGDSIFRMTDAGGDYIHRELNDGNNYYREYYRNAGTTSIGWHYINNYGHFGWGDAGCNPGTTDFLFSVDQNSDTAMRVENINTGTASRAVFQFKTNNNNLISMLQYGANNLMNLYDITDTGMGVINFKGTHGGIIGTETANAPLYFGTENMGAGIISGTTQYWGLGEFISGGTGVEPSRLLSLNLASGDTGISFQIAGVEKSALYWDSSEALFRVSAPDDMRIDGRTLEIADASTNAIGRVFFNESNGVYGFSVAYAGQSYLGIPANEFGIVRHSNDATGDVILTMTRDTGITKIGDIAGGNYFKIKNTGKIEFESNATVWDDIQTSLIGRQLSSTAGKVDYNWTENTITMAKGGNIATTNDRLIWNIQLSHSTKVDSNFNLHIHFEQPNSSTYEFTCQYRIQNNGSAKTTTWTTITCDSATDNIYTYVSGTLNQLVSFPSIDLTGVGISGVIQFRLVRDDTINNDIEVTFVDGHYEKSDVGSESEFVK